MKQNKENILNECLERLLEGETIEQCLQGYPEQAAELKPLLETALAAKKASAIQPRAEFKARASYQFRSALKEIATKRTTLVWFPRWATVATIALVLLLAGSGTVVAAGSSMPDSPLYPVKLATEETRLALTFSPLGKASLYAEMADKRVAEIVYLADKGDARQIELVTQRLDGSLETLAVLASEGEEASMLMAPVPAPEKDVEVGEEGRAPSDNQAKLRTTLENDAANNTAALNTALEEAPEAVKPALQEAIAISEAGYQNAISSLD
jgi:hypothetical protein